MKVVQYILDCPTLTPFRLVNLSHAYCLPFFSKTGSSDFEKCGKKCGNNFS